MCQENCRRMTRGGRKGMKNKGGRTRRHSGCTPPEGNHMLLGFMSTPTSSTTHGKHTLPLPYFAPRAAGVTLFLPLVFAPHFAFSLPPFSPCFLFLTAVSSRSLLLGSLFLCPLLLLLLPRSLAGVRMLDRSFCLAGLCRRYASMFKAILERDCSWFSQGKRVGNRDDVNPDL